jgi:hypothetical protein
MFQRAARRGSTRVCLWEECRGLNEIAPWSPSFLPPARAHACTHARMPALHTLRLPLPLPLVGAERRSFRGRGWGAGMGATLVPAGMHRGHTPPRSQLEAEETLHPPLRGLAHSPALASPRPSSLLPGPRGPTLTSHGAAKDEIFSNETNRKRKARKHKSACIIESLASGRSGDDEEKAGNMERVDFAEVFSLLPSVLLVLEKLKTAKTGNEVAAAVRV